MDDLPHSVDGSPDADLTKARSQLHQSLCDMHGAVIADRYKLLEVLGEGGFGIVWLAEQREPVVRKVAIKMIKRGMDSDGIIARFEQERQALAMMDHPHVAKVYDGGVTAPNHGGLPFFTMEYVQGEPITEFCDRERMSVNERLSLFVQVCDAVQHAHTKMIIHRDIKPSNILVRYGADGRPEVKVIDFGVAKALNQSLGEHSVFTQLGQLIGTPAYMSPEQAEMGWLDVDARTDVYSLGVVLYELITGLPPFEPERLRAAAMGELLKIIREVDAPRPSTRLSDVGAQGSEIAHRRRIDVRTLGSALKGELDWIVMKCLEKERGRRYETASALSMEVQRYLTDQPVLARPPSNAYRLAKFARRRKGTVAAGTTILLLLLGGLIGVSAALGEAQRQRASARSNEALALDAARRAEAEADRARRAEADAAAALDAALIAREDAETAQEAESQRAAELERVAAFQASQLQGINPQEMGNSIHRTILESDRSAMNTHTASEDATSFADMLAGINFTNVAMQALDQNVLSRALEAISDQFDDQPSVQARLLETVATTYYALGMARRGVLVQTKALDIRRRIDGADHPDTLKSMNDLGVLLHSQGRWSDAESIHRETVERRRRVLGDNHPHTVLSLGNLALALHSLGRLEEAEQHYLEVLEIERRLLGDEHPRTVQTRSNLAGLLISLRRFAEAEPFLRDTVAIRRQIRGDDHPDTLLALNNLGGLLRTLERHDEAEPLLREALEGRRRVLGDDHPGTLSSLNSLGVLLRSMGRLDEAEPYLLLTLKGLRRALGEDHPNTLISTLNVSALYRDLGRLNEAADLLQNAEAAMRRRFTGSGELHLATYLLTIGQIRSAMDYDPNRFRSAESHLLEAHAILERAHTPSHPDVKACVRELIKLYSSWSVSEPDRSFAERKAKWQMILDSANTEH